MDLQTRTDDKFYHRSDKVQLDCISVELDKYYSDVDIECRIKKFWSHDEVDQKCATKNMRLFHDRMNQKCVPSKVFSGGKYS